MYLLHNNKGCAQPLALETEWAYSCNDKKGGLVEENRTKSVHMNPFRPLFPLAFIYLAAFHFVGGEKEEKLGINDVNKS